MNKMRAVQQIISRGMILFTLVGCTGVNAAVSTPIRTTSTLAPTSTPTSTPTPEPTATITPTFTPTPAPLSAEEINASVADVILAGSIQEYTRCSLDAAIWGNYDIKVTVSSGYTNDKSAHFFTIDHGVFSQGTASEEPSSDATTNGTGIVKIDDQESAFDLGIPFFITDVTYDGKSTLNLTVVTNPKNTIGHASIALEEFQASSRTITFKPFTPSPKPQKLTFDVGDKVLEKGMYLLILKEISHTDGLCLLSNQVDLGSLKSP